MSNTYHSNHDPIVIVNGARTAMGSFQGSLSDATASELGATAIKEAIKKAGIAPESIDEVIMGNVLSAGLKQGPARQAVLQAGLPNSTGCTTINKLCGSGMKAVMLAHDLLKAHTNEVMIAGGMESMSNAPYIMPKARTGLRIGHQKIMDHMFLDGLEDASTGTLMGQFAQITANKKNISRETMDSFAITSLKRAKNAIEQGYFKAEIAAHILKTRKGEQIVDTDEQPLTANLEKIPKLRPAFAKEGTITAANASSISDGASALILMRESTAKSKGLQPLAKILHHATQSQAPEEFTSAPIEAINKVLEKTNWSADDVDLWEINEAFAMVTLMPISELNINHEKVNIYGGACALGHPIGSTGSRIILTLIHASNKE